MSEKAYVLGQLGRAELEIQAYEEVERALRPSPEAA
jgi:hypothetical protein